MCSSPDDQSVIILSSPENSPMDAAYENIHNAADTKNLHNVTCNAQTLSATLYSADVSMVTPPCGQVVHSRPDTSVVSSPRLPLTDADMSPPLICHLLTPTKEAATQTCDLLPPAAQRAFWTMLEYLERIQVKYS